MESLHSQREIDHIPNQTTAMDNTHSSGVGFGKQVQKDISYPPVPLQLSSPPNSTSSSSPSPSIDTANHTYSATNSPLARRRRAPSLASSTRHHEDTINVEITPTNTNVLPFEIFDDEIHGKLLQSSNSSTLKDTSKRRLESCPLQDPRGPAHRRTRSQTYSGYARSIEGYQGQQSIYLNRSLRGSAVPCPPERGLVRNSLDSRVSITPNPSGPNTPSIQQKDSFWHDASEDPPEDISNKRMKNELRGKAGRVSRTTKWSDQKPIPSIRRKSTMSFLTEKFDAISPGKSDHNDSHLSSQDSSQNDTAPCADSKSSNDNLQPLTPVKPKNQRRAPLSDISFETELDLKSTSLNEPNMFFEPVESISVVNALPLGPLMTRQPRKGTTRQRFKILNPFPMNPSYWNEYAEDTLNYITEIESRYDRFMYMAADSDFCHNRMVLVAWLIEISYGLFGLQPATLHAGVNILDRYLSIKRKDPIQLDQLQGIGLCALMIASKLEEDGYSITFTDCLRACDAYTCRDLAHMEVGILVALKFEILVASATGFSDYFKRAVHADDSVMDLTDFLCDLSLTSHKFLDYNTSQIAASALWIALCTVHQDWNEELAILSGYTRTDMTPCSLIFKELVCSPTDTHELQRAFHYKYHFETKFSILMNVLQ
ncbi:hypothetical protein BGZ76_007922 [Entomortierella beljakovae]|nr:hypothetical protein BGZ76_007922 [Entomortierella beljakovae]